ncbi:MAG: hypothetical protein KF845_00280 [Cyclobacteriaceae bacterium]|nr:hypothetical protein [Cyclobacteriaceae bacterium]
MLCYTQAFTQNFDGLYVGTLFTEKNAVSIRATGSLIAGTIFLNAQERVVFFGNVSKDTISGTMIIDQEGWVFNGSLFEDSLILSLKFNDHVKESKLKRVSPNPSKNPVKFLGKATLDLRLVGEWVLWKMNDKNGSTLPIKGDMEGMSYVIISDGTYFLRFPSLLKIKPNFDFSSLKNSWITNKSRLILVSSSMNSEYDYEIKDNNLILKHETGTSFFRKKGE